MNLIQNSDPLNLPWRQIMHLSACLIAASFLTLPTMSMGQDTVTKHQELPGFSSIRVTIPADVTIRQTGKTQASITTEPAIFDKLKVAVSGDTLQIGANSNFQTKKPLVIEVEVSQLQRIETQAPANVVVDGLQGKSLTVSSSGSGDISLKKLNLESIRIDSSGSSSITAEGKTQSQQVNLQGAGDYKAEGLRSERAKVTIEGAGEAQVWAEQKLEGVVGGSATLRYRGNPQIEQQINGAASIERL